jgi:hypothetical protein
MGGRERERGLGGPGGTRAGENGLRMAGRPGHDGRMAWFLSDNLPEYSATVGGLLSRRLTRPSAGQVRVGPV